MIGSGLDYNSQDKGMSKSYEISCVLSHVFLKLCLTLPAIALVISMVSQVDSHPEPASTSWPSPTWTATERNWRNCQGAPPPWPPGWPRPSPWRWGRQTPRCCRALGTQQVAPFSTCTQDLLTAFKLLIRLVITSSWHCFRIFGHLARFPLSLSQAMLSSSLNGVTMGGKMPVRLTCTTIVNLFHW